MIKLSECKSPKDFNCFEVLRAFHKAGFKGTYLGCPGSGKTRIGVELIGLLSISDLNKFLEYARILIIVPTENLRDNEWENELVKWGYAHLRERIEIICINTARKLKGNVFDLVIVDEAHTIISTENFKFFENNHYHKLLCLSGTIPDEKLEILKNIAPVFFHLSLESALSKGIVCNFIINTVCVNLSETVQERYNKYSNILHNYMKMFSSIKEIEKCIHSQEERKRKAQSMNTTSDYIRNIAVSLMKAIRNRTDLLYSCEDKIKITTDIINKHNDTKIIVFTERIEQAEKIALSIKDRKVLVFNSDVKGVKNRNAILKEFTEEKTAVLVACKALNVGFNVPECSVAIIESGNSSIIDFPQRLGRVLRISEDPNKLSIVYQIICNNTVEHDWARKRTKDIPKEYIVSYDADILFRDLKYEKEQQG